MKRLFTAPLIILALLNPGCGAHQSTLLPGTLSDGRVLLPNGWMLSPAGTQVGVGELPLSLDVTPDNRYIVTTNNGTAEQSISVVETASWQVVQTLPVSASWLGVRFIDHGKQLLLSGGNLNRIYLYNFDHGRAALADSIPLGRPWPTEKIWVAGFDFDESSGNLFVAGKQSDSLYVVDIRSKSVLHRMKLPAKPYTCLASRNHPFVYVSLWGGSAVAFVDKSRHSILKTVPVGEHPNDMVESSDGKRLFVANANQNTVSVIDIEQAKVMETISCSLYADAPEGSTPNSVAIDAADRLLYIANADNNAIAVVDISTRGASRPLGFIPSGWYPTCVRILKNTNHIVVANGKGASSQANNISPDRPGGSFLYIGSLFKGTLSRIDPPSPEQLVEYTRRVYSNSPLNEKLMQSPARDHPVFSRPGRPSPIKHVFYVIKENRTYDQVFGDMKQGNGDPSLCLFPDSVSPNHHALAREFVLLDNFYCDGEVSADGHNWSMGAYATDYVEKTWPTSYGDRGGDYEYEGGYETVYPSAGYLWDNCQRAGLTYRTYGEFTDVSPTFKDSSLALTPSLVGHVSPFYRGWDLSYSDVLRVQAWEKEFTRYEQEGGLPQFQVIKLPNDHTEGTRKGSLTPRAYVAQNDVALGMLVDRISHSKFWKESAIFVVEDDAQNGPDHVDAHRTVALVISPYAKRGFVDSELYSTSGMVRTMELILGLPPLSQFDAAASPMDNSFVSTPDLTPFVHRQANLDLNEKNIAGAYGEERSGRMDFSRQDAAPEAALNEIIWKSIRGSASEMPPPVRSVLAQTSLRN